jgi:hypothetical protein
VRHVMRLSEKMLYSTVRLICAFDGIPYSGTGFFFDFFRKGKERYPAIITNKHVVKNADNITLYINRGDNQNWPIHGDPIKIELGSDIQKQLIDHPNTNVDLILIPIGGLINKLLEEGNRPFYTGIDYSTIPKNDTWNSLHALEDIAVVGYPNTLEDEVNKLPIFIKGNTATHPLINFEGRSEFLVNANVLHGSSGSPVFLLNETFYRKSRRYEKGRDRLRLLGVLYGGYDSPVYEKQTGSAKLNATDYVTTMSICKVIKSTEIKEFETLFKAIIKRLGL